MALAEYLHKIVNRENLTQAQAYAAMDCILQGDATTAQIAAFLTALRMKGETPGELVGFAQAMREKAAPVSHGVPGQTILDTCGSGGDGLHTFNISTVAAFVAAGAGVRVAKHGNRSASGVCGSADVLESLGVEIGAPVERMASAIREIGIAFLFAPAIHPAMKHAKDARSELKMRTAFNLLGPLTNPAGATAQLAGAPSIRAAGLMAEALAGLGLQRGYVVHGLDGLDEISTAGESLVLEIRRGAIAEQTVTPEDFGIARARIEDLAAATLDENREIARSVLAGNKGPCRDIVLVNASAALRIAGKASSFREGVALAAESIDSGKAAAKLDQLVRYTQAAQVA